MVVEPALGDGRDQGRSGDSLLLDERERLLGVGGPQHHPAAVQQRAQQARAGEREVVSEGQRGEVDRVGSERADLGAAAGVVDVVVVRAGDELGQPGGPAGEQEDGDRAAVRPVRVHGCPVLGGAGRGAQLPQVHGVVAGFVAEYEDVLKGGRVVGDLDGHRLVVVVLEDVRHRDGHGLAVLDEVADLVSAVSGQCHHRDDAEAQTCVCEDHELGGVGELHHEPVVRVEPERGQAQGHGVRPFGELPVGQPPVAVDERDRVGGGVGGGVEPVADGVTFPVALRGVALGVFRGPGDSTVAARPWHDRSPQVRSAVCTITASRAISPSAVSRRG